MIVRVVEVGNGESLNIHVQLTAVIVSFPVRMREEGKEWWSMRKARSGMFRTGTVGDL